MIKLASKVLCLTGFIILSCTAILVGISSIGVSAIHDSYALFWFTIFGIFSCGIGAMLYHTEEPQ